MCLILFSWKTHEQYDLILAANRDEFYSRPTKRAGFWSDHKSIFGGRDLQNGGTWMAVNRNGKFAALTNHRDISKLKSSAPSRGALTTNFLINNSSPEEYIQSIQPDCDKYNGFNLLIGDQNSLWYFNNVNMEYQTLKPGLYGLSNALLDDPWHKVVEGKKSLFSLTNQSALTTEQLLEILVNQELAEDDMLPETGLPYDKEKALSSMFIATEGYGTRCSTTLLMKEDELIIQEKTYDIPGQAADEVQEKIKITY